MLESHCLILEDGCKFSQGLAGCSCSCHCQHACLLLFSWAASGKYSNSISLFFKPTTAPNFVILQVGKMGSGAIALSLPFSCILGLLASMTSTTMGRLTLYLYWDKCFLLANFVISLSHYLEFGFSEEKVCLGLCNYPVWISGPSCSPLVFIGECFFHSFFLLFLFSVQLQSQTL